MISEHSRRNLELAFHQALRGNLVREAADVCEIVPVDCDRLGDHPGDKRLFLTLSSFVFRLLVIFRVIETPASLAYYAPAAAAQNLDEVFAEVANMCGGALSRQLSDSFPHLAMSTPHAVSGQCMAFIGDLKPRYLASYLISINHSVQVQATLCLCCAAPIEVSLSATATEAEQNVGELELF